MAGTINISLTQQFDAFGNPLSGGLLYFFQAATSTPQNAYIDTNLTLPHPNPIVLDSSGRVPSFYLADGNIRVRLTDSSGVVQFDESSLLVIGPSSGSGSGASIDPTTIFQTGDVMWLDVSGSRDGWVRDNGRTIGSATSGASERANSDCNPLYLFLWNTYSDTLCPVPGGRGLTAADDWAANKQITLPDKRRLTNVGLDDMGNSSSGGFTGVPFSKGDGVTPGSILGEMTHLLTVNQLPAHNHPVTDPKHHHGLSTDFGNHSLSGGGVDSIDVTSGTGKVTDDALTGITVGNTGGGAAHNIMQFSALGTWFRKL